jgi:hypothetical protein
MYELIILNQFFFFTPLLFLKGRTEQGSNEDREPCEQQQASNKHFLTDGQRGRRRAFGCRFAAYFFYQWRFRRGDTLTAALPTEATEPTNPGFNNESASSGNGSHCHCA